MRFLLFFFCIAALANIPGGKLPTGVKPLSYDLALNVNPRIASFSGKVSIRLHFNTPTKEFWMHGQDLTVKQASIRAGSEIISVTYQQKSSEGAVLIHASQTIPAGEATLNLSYEALFQKDLSGLYRVSQNKQDYIYSQFEPIAARTCFPSFDEPRFKTPFKISLTIPESDSGLSNALLKQEVQHADKTKTLVFEQTPPLPTYLIAFAVGPFDIISAPHIDNKIPFRGIAPKGQGSKLAYALAETPKFLKILENYFGIAYPYSKLDIIAVPDFAAGAMENAGAITFRDSLLLMDQKTAPVWQIRRFAEVMAHELAHQWFGNLVTLSWWEDIWLNEAFATWMATKVLEEYKPEYYAYLESLAETQMAMSEDSLSSARKIQEPIHSHHDIYSAFDSITYTKGAAVIDMFEGYIGPFLFQKGVRSYLRRFANKNTDTQDFISELSKASGQNLAPSFGSFLTQTGVPLLKFERNRYQQVRYLPFGSVLASDRTWIIPFCPEKISCQVLAQAQGTLSDFGFPAQDGRGYYRFSGTYPVDSSHLSDADKIVLIANLKASFGSGLLNTSELMPQLGAFAQSSNRFIAMAPISTLKWLQDHLITPELKSAFQSYAQRVYLQKPLIKDPEEQKLFDVEYLDFKANVAQDQKTRQDLLQKGLAYLKNPSSVDANQVRLALAVLIQEKPQYFSKLKNRLFKSQDAIQRSSILKALAESNQALDLILSESLRKNEVLTLLGSYMTATRTPEKGLGWLQKNLSALMQVLPEKGSGHLPWALGTLCSESGAKKVETLFQAVIEKIPGGPRALQGVLEQIRLCSALSEHQRANVWQFFEGINARTR